MSAPFWTEIEGKLFHKKKFKFFSLAADRLLTHMIYTCKPKKMTLVLTGKAYYKTSVPDPPDTHVFGPPGSESGFTSQR
jgi:hypothetical protein